MTDADACQTYLCSPNASVRLVPSSTDTRGSGRDVRELWAQDEPCRGAMARLEVPGVRPKNGTSVVPPVRPKGEETDDG